MLSFAFNFRIEKVRETLYSSCDKVQRYKFKPTNLNEKANKDKLNPFHCLGLFNSGF